MQTTEWHKQCLKSMRDTLKREQRVAAQHELRVLDLENRIDVYQAQIDRAVKEGKPGFDSERYNIPRTLRGDK